MDKLTALAVDEFLDRTADRTPTPGGGSVTACAGALACAMARMVAAYSIGKKTPDDDRKKIEKCKTKLRRADEIMRRLVIEDASAYSNLQETAGNARRNENDQTLSSHQSAVMAAISVPLEMAATASEALALMDEFKSVASRYLISDLGVAAVLADATARAARFSVLVNLPELYDVRSVDSVLDQINRIVPRCGQLCASVLAHVNSRMRNPTVDTPGGSSPTEPARTTTESAS